MREISCDSVHFGNGLCNLVVRIDLLLRESPVRIVNEAEQVLRGLENGLAHARTARVVCQISEARKQRAERRRDAGSAQLLENSLYAA